MGNKGVLLKNYFIYPDTVAEFGVEIECVMADTDRAMEEASEVIAEIASLTERVPSQIRSGDLLELCETAQVEIRSFDFLSYGKRVNQGLQNLLDQNQYITDNFIRKMRANTKRMREFGGECRRLKDLITYSGADLPMKGIALSSVSNAEVTNLDVGEETEQNNILDYFMTYDEAKRIGIGLLDAQICSKLGITDINDRVEIIQALLDSKSGVFDILYNLNRTSSPYYQNVMLDTLLEIKEEYFLLFQQYRYERRGVDMKVLCDPVVAYSGYPQVEDFDHTIQLGRNVYNPYDPVYIDATQGNQQANCYRVDMTERDTIVPRGWNSYMNRDLDKMMTYYTETAKFDCTREGNQLTVDSGNQVFTFQLLDDKWWMDENGRYLITVGPNVLLTEYGKDGDYSLGFNRFSDYFGRRIDVILVNDKDPNDVLTLECIYGGDIKAHTEGPENGVYMTGRSFLSSDEEADPDGSIVEFIGSPNDDNGIMSDYHVELIIVYDNDAEVN